MTAAEPSSLIHIDQPEGWTFAKAGDLLTLVNGFPFKPSQWKERGVPIIRIQNLNKPKAPFNYCSDHLPEKYAIKKDDLLFAWSGTPGTSFGAHIWRGGRGWLNQHIFRVEFDQKVFDKRFLRLSINRNLDEYISQAHGGVGLAHITKGKFEAIYLALPPLAEQKRIVERVERLLTPVNAARARLAHVPAILKRFRQAVLAAACSGRLTADWRERHSSDLEKADEPVNRLRDQNMSAPPSVWYEPSYEIRSEKELPDGWIHIALGNLGSWVTGGTPSKSKASYWQDGAVPWLSPKDMKVESIADTQDHITKRAVSETRLKLLPQDTLLFVVRGMILAHTFPVAISARPLTINQDMRAITPYSGVLPHYLLRALQAESRSILFAVRESTHGTRRLESETLKCWPISLPTPKEQVEIVRRVEKLFKLADAIEKRVAGATARAEKLTQAILAKAFRGELVPTEAELARREGRSYEPASALLARIHALPSDQNRRPRPKDRCGK